MADDFVRRFTEVWDAPSPERLRGLLQPDVRLVQPIMPTTQGADAAVRAFARLLRSMPDLRGDVVGWRGDAEVVFIELRLAGTFGGRPLTWDLVDRIELRDGLVAERVSYFDPLPLALAMARRPRGWRSIRPLLSGGSA